MEPFIYKTHINVLKEATGAHICSQKLLSINGFKFCRSVFRCVNRKSVLTNLIHLKHICQAKFFWGKMRCTWTYYAYYDMRCNLTYACTDHDPSREQHEFIWGERQNQASCHEDEARYYNDQLPSNPIIQNPTNQSKDCSTTWGRRKLFHTLN